MNNNHVWPEYLRGEDLQKDFKWCQFSLTIAKVIPPGAVKAADGTVIDRPIIEFEKAEKRFIVGKTNQRLITVHMGSKPEQWIGQRLTLFPVKGDWFGVKDAIAVRVRVPEGSPNVSIKRAAMGQDITGQCIRVEQ